MRVGCRLCVGVVAMLGVCPAARAVVVRGVVRTPLGLPVAGARVQLILGQRDVADAVSGFDGSYEIRSDQAGRFVLLTSGLVAGGRPAVEVSAQFYGGRTDQVHMDIALEASHLTPPTTAVETGRETPLAQLSADTARVESNRLLPRQEVGDVLVEHAASAVLVRRGETGAPAELYLRGAGPDAIGLVIDGVDAQRVGGAFDLGTLSTAGLAAIGSEQALELTAGANPLRQTDAKAGMLTLHAARADGGGLRVIYAGDAGSLDTMRHDVTAGYTRGRLDALAEFVRFDTANSLPATKFHEVSSEANVGFAVTANTTLRATLRDEISAAGLPSPYAFYGVQPQGRLAQQNLAAGFTYETRTVGDWHTLVRYGLVRDRQQTFDDRTPAAGLPVTITGANGSSASGIASFIALPPREDLVSNRDEYEAQVDHAFKPYLAALLTARYKDERAADLLPATLGAGHATTRGEQTELAFAGTVEGDIRHRVFYQASGTVDFGNDAAGAPAGVTNTFGLRGAPRLGLSWAPLRAGRRRLSGTTLHATAATGFREPTLAERTAFPAATALARSRTFDVGVSQNLVHQKLTARLTYFSAQYAHQTELLAPETTVSAAVLSNQLAYGARGLEATLRYAPVARLQVQGGYTYLAANVEESAAQAVSNLAFPGVAVGATTALAGQRPFHRPAHSGFATAEYNVRKATATLSGEFAGRSDDTTALVRDPGLLLPNRNLAPGYVRLDASVSFRISRRLVVYTESDNLTDNSHLAPAGYLSTPFVARAGLRLILGHGI